MNKPARFTGPARLLTRAEAAAYCGISISTFADWQRRGIIPKALPATHRWDRRALDLALDKVSGLATVSEPTSAYDQWKGKKDARRA